MNCHFIYAFKSALPAVLALMFLHSACASAAPLRLTVVLSEQGGAYQEYSNTLAAQLDNKNVALSVIAAGEELPEADLVIAAGMKAATYVTRNRPAAMLAVLILKEGYARLRNDFPLQVESGAIRYSAIYLDQPLKRQLDLISSVLPEARSVGVLYTAPPKELGALRAMVAARKLELNERSVTSASQIHSALQELLISSDVLLALPDAEIYNTSTIRNILLATYRNKVPLIGFSAGYVKAGALCAVFSTPEQIATQSVVFIRQYAEQRTLPAAQYSTAFEVSVNEQVARSLGLTTKNVSQVRSDIRN